MEQVEKSSLCEFFPRFAGYSLIGTTITSIVRTSFFYFFDRFYSNPFFFFSLTSCRGEFDPVRLDGDSNSDSYGRKIEARLRDEIFTGWYAPSKLVVCLGSKFV